MNDLVLFLIIATEMFRLGQVRRSFWRQKKERKERERKTYQKVISVIGVILSM